MHYTQRHHPRHSSHPISIHLSKQRKEQSQPQAESMRISNHARPWFEESKRGKKNHSLSIPSRIPNLLFKNPPIARHPMCARSTQKTRWKRTRKSIYQCFELSHPCCASWIVKQRWEIIPLAKSDEIFEWVNEWLKKFNVSEGLPDWSVLSDEVVALWICYNKIACAISLVAELACCRADNGDRSGGLAYSWGCLMKEDFGDMATF